MGSNGLQVQDVLDAVGLRRAVAAAAVPLPPRPPPAQQQRRCKVTTPTQVSAAVAVTDLVDVLHG